LTGGALLFVLNDVSLLLIPEKANQSPPPPSPVSLADENGSLTSPPDANGSPDDVEEETNGSPLFVDDANGSSLFVVDANGSSLEVVDAFIVLLLPLDANGSSLVVDVDDEKGSFPDTAPVEKGSPPDEFDVAANGSEPNALLPDD